MAKQIGIYKNKHNHSHTLVSISTTWSRIRAFDW